MKEHQLAQQLLFDFESVTSKDIEKALAVLDSGTLQLQEGSKSEVQRRGAAEQEYATILQPDVMAVLTEGDQLEHERENGHAAAHAKFADTVRRAIGCYGVFVKLMW